MRFKAQHGQLLSNSRHLKESNLIFLIYRLDTLEDVKMSLHRISISIQNYPGYLWRKSDVYCENFAGKRIRDLQMLKKSYLRLILANPPKMLIKLNLVIRAIAESVYSTRKRSRRFSQFLRMINSSVLHYQIDCNPCKMYSQFVVLNFDSLWM